MQSDAATWLDSAVFSIGFCLATAGITLTQLFRDDFLAGSPKRLEVSTSIAFWMTRKVTGILVFASMILGFWIVGWWWIAVGIGMAFLGAVIVNVTMVWNRALWPIYSLCISGVVLISWAQSPLLKFWGIYP